jgi:hypothetical protein
MLPLLPDLLQNGGAWPKAGGATGSIRLKPEIGHGANAGEVIASINNSINTAGVEPIKAKYPAGFMHMLHFMVTCQIT